MAKLECYELVPDKKGALWDLLMYIPVVTVLVLIALKLWYGGGSNQSYAYILMFAGSFIFFIGANRVLSSRLMMLPNCPRVLEVGKNSVVVGIKDGSRVELVKDLKYFQDYAGKSFGLSGMDLSGKKRQFVFHKGQFSSEASFKDLRSLLSVYK